VSFGIHVATIENEALLISVSDKFFCVKEIDSVMKERKLNVPVPAANGTALFNLNRISKKKTRLCYFQNPS
jgi:hypothetical protein